MSGLHLSVRNPRTGRYDYEVETTTVAELDVVAARLRAGADEWSRRPIGERARVLEALQSALESARPAIAAALEVDTGRRHLAQREIGAVMQAIAAWLARLPALQAEDWKQSRALPSLRYRTQWCPYPLIGVISPWNFPFLLSFVDVIPALLAGCSVLLKPSEVTPRWIAPFREALASVPELHNVLALHVGGPEVGEAVIDRADAICFTGSVPTGRKVAMRAATRMIPASLELGGKDPLVILASADLERAVTVALRGSVAATGQACQSIERIYVARPIFPQFVERLVGAAGEVRLNWPDIDRGEIGPIIFARQAETIAAQLADSVSKGARVLCGGRIEQYGGGLWMRPTVLVDVDHTMTVMTEETFGPVMPVMAFDTVDEAVRLANGSQYGLSAAVMAATQDEAENVARRIDAGAISLNDAALTTVFSESAKDSFKLSGLGRSRMGTVGFERFFRAKALIAQTGQPEALATLAELGPAR